MRFLWDLHKTGRVRFLPQKSSEMGYNPQNRPQRWLAAGRGLMLILKQLCGLILFVQNAQKTAPSKSGGAVYYPIHNTI